MDRKIKLLAAVSVIAVMTSGCSRYGTGQNVGSDGHASNASNTTTAGSGQVARTGQVSGGGLFGQRRSSTCAPCAANKKNTYTYKPAAKPVYKAASKPVAGQHNQQYYIDKWNREQAALKNKQSNTQNYTGYGNTGASNTTYYDYSSAGKATTAAPAANVSASNKSIYTGSYQQPTYKPYQPTTYTGGSSGTTSTTAVASTTSGGGSSYVVKKGDTVFEVMRQTGVYWKDIISMNNLIAPAYTINPGQTLRLK